jgi:hypothetical protein
MGVLLDVKSGTGAMVAAQRGGYEGRDCQKSESCSPALSVTAGSVCLALDRFWGIQIPASPNATLALLDIALDRLFVLRLRRTPHTSALRGGVRQASAKRSGTGSWEVCSLRPCASVAGTVGRGPSAYQLSKSCYDEDNNALINETRTPEHEME